MSPSVMASEWMVQFQWRAVDERRMAFACRAAELAKLILLYHVFPNLRPVL